MQSSLLKKLALTTTLFADTLGISTTQATPSAFTGSYTQASRFRAIRHGLLCLTVIGAALFALSTSGWGQTVSLTGSYTENFDSMGTSGTAPPSGWSHIGSLGGDNNTWGSSIPASGTYSAASAGTVNNTLIANSDAANATAIKSDTQAYNLALSTSSSDRSLGTSPTTGAGQILQLRLINNTGAALSGIKVGYDIRRFTAVGTANELPGYQLFYSTDGGTTWVNVSALNPVLSGGTVNVPNSVGVTTASSASTITFGSAVAASAEIRLRWADDNAVQTSPDQLIAIDNIVIGISTNTAPTVALNAPLNGAAFAAGTNITMSATASDSNGVVTKVEFFSGATSLGAVSNAPYDLIWSNVVLGSYSLTAKATDNDGASTTTAAAAITVVPDTGTGGLYFDGVNDYVTFGAATSSLGVSNFTVECWFKRTGTGATTTTGTGGVTATPLVTKGRGEADGSNVDCNWFLGFDANGKLTADFEDFNTGLNHPITGNAAFTSNQWQHAAVTYSSSGTNGTWTLFLNGGPDATNNFTGTNMLMVTPRFDSIQHAGLATAMTSAGTAAGFFNGKLDEVRVWNHARSAADIASNFNRPLPAGTGLIARWSLDETNGLIAFNSIAGGVNGTLTNGPLRVAGYPFASTVTITSPANNTEFDAPASITVAASATSVSGTVTNVEFLAGATSLGSAATAPFSVTWSVVAAGSYALSAIASDDSGIQFTSAVVNVSVVLPNLPATVAAITSTINGATDVAKNPTLGVTVSDPEGSANLTVTFYGRKVAPAPAADFTIIALPDTQFYSQTYSNLFFAQTDWIVANRAASNIAYVAHLGDLVQNGDHGGNDNEWQNATNALYRLENPATTGLPDGIPYGITLGNHDQGATGTGSATDATTFYNQYFGTNHFLGRGYYGGNYGTNNDNHYDLFSANGYDFVVIYFEYDPTMTSTNNAVLNWANGLLQTYSNRKGIVVSHYLIDSYTAGSPFGAQGQTIYNELKANANLTLMLCGHVNPNGYGRRTDVFNGNAVHTVLADYQDTGSGGDGWMRIFTFSPANNIIRSTTYSPWLNQYQTGTNHQFDLNVSLTPANPFIVLGTVTGVASGSEASVVWPRLQANTNYEWYVTVSDGHSTSTSPVAQFATSASFPPVPPTVALTSPANAAGFVAPASLTLTASASDADGLVANVAFYQGTTLLGNVATAPYSFTWNNVAAGAYALTAVAADDDGLNTTSAVVNITVTEPLPAPTSLTATGGVKQVVLAWNEVSGATSYTVRYGTVNGGPYPSSQTSLLAGVTITNLAAGVPLYFVVAANDANGSGAFSASASATPTYAPGVWRFGVMGDTQWTYTSDTANPNSVPVSIINQLNPQFIAAGVKFVVQVGDLTDNGATAAITSTAQARQALYNAGIGFFPLRGNHESSQAAAVQFTNDFPQTKGLGTNVTDAVNFTSASNSLAGLSYTFDYNNARFVLLDQFTRLDGTGSDVNNAMLDQVPWVNSTLSGRTAGTHAFVFNHKNLSGQNHVDCMFGANPAGNPAAQNAFIGSMASNAVGYVISGHDHVYQRSMIASPNAQFAARQIICASDSSKFYTPANPSVDQTYDSPARETSVTQDLYRIGYYIFTVDGAKVTVDYYASDDTFPSGGSPNPTPTLHFQKRDTFGYSLNGKSFLVPQGQAYTNVQDSIASGGGFTGTAVQILAGTNLSTTVDGSARHLTREITTGWATNAPGSASDVLTLWGLTGLATNRTDAYVLSVSYNPAVVSDALAASGAFCLAAKTAAGAFTNAVTLNAGSPHQFVPGAYDNCLSLGCFGVDTNAHTVWAVIDYQGEFSAQLAGNAVPVVSVPATIAVEATNASGNVVNFFVTANDAEDGALTPTVTPVSGSTFALGTNTVTATATDSNGSSTTNKFLVIVRDTTAPVITLNGANPFTNFQSVAFADPGATAYDVVSGSVPLTTNSNVNVTNLGTYSVQYLASDAGGNVSTNTRTVQVIALPVPANLGGAVVSGGGNNGFQLSFDAAIGQPYHIIGTDDLTQPLTNWMVLASGIVTNNPVTFIDAAAVSNVFRFYRVVSP